MTATPERTGRLNRFLWAFLVLFILVASIGGFVALRYFKPKPEVKPVERQLSTVRVDIPQLRSGGLPVFGNGLIQPRTQVVLTAEVSARIVTVSPTLVAGGAVRKGQELIRLDNAGFRASVSQSKADLSGAKSSLALAEQSVKRTQDLIEQGFLSRQTLDERIAARDQALANMERARAANHQQGINFSRTRIYSPFDGRVLSASVNAGDTVQPGRELGRLFDDSALEVAVSLTDTDMALIDNPWGDRSAGEPASALIIVEHGGRKFEWDAVVDRVEAAIDPATRTFKVVVRTLEPKNLGRAADGSARPGPPLLVGMYASVQIAGRDQGNFVSIERDALRAGSVIWTVDESNAIRIVPVEVLGEFDSRVAIAKGELTDKSRIVTSDLKVVTEGMTVRVIGDTPARQSLGGTRPNKT